MAFTVRSFCGDQAFICRYLRDDLRNADRLFLSCPINFEATWIQPGFPFPALWKKVIGKEVGSPLIWRFFECSVSSFQVRAGLRRLLKCASWGLFQAAVGARNCFLGRTRRDGS